MKKLLLIGGALMAGIATQAQTYVNAGFEQWHSFTESGNTLETPDSWYCPDSLANSPTIAFVLGGNTHKQCFKSTDAHSGTYAARIESHVQGSLGVVPGILGNASASVDIATQQFSYHGGTAISQYIDTVSAWIKYIPNGIDTGGITVQVVKSGAGAGGADSIIGSGYLSVNATSAYTKMSVPVTYITSSLMPDKILTLFSSSPFATSGGQDSSVMLVDDATMVARPTAISPVKLTDAVVKWYPNPANGTLHLIGTTGEALLWEAYNAAGQLVAHTTVTGETTINTASYAPGAYFYRVTGKAGAVLQQGHILIQH